jgi:hypothetical protein
MDFEILEAHQPRARQEIGLDVVEGIFHDLLAVGSTHNVTSEFLFMSRSLPVLPLVAGGITLVGAPFCCLVLRVRKQARGMY